MLERHNRDRLILFAAHSDTFWWRLGWRFNTPGLSAKLLLIDSAGPAPEHHETTPADVLLIDLGWTEPEQKAAMQLLSDFRKSRPATPVCALVPRLQPESRPAWAELGVGLVLDRATAPPEIVDNVMKWLADK